MKNIRKVISILLFVMCLFGCNTNASKTPSLSNVGIIYDDKFGGFYIDISIDDFNELGFKYGDSVDLVLSNGITLYDVPYYNGYYTKTHEILVCAYPNYEYIKVHANNGDDLYYQYNLNENATVDIVLNSSEKYKATQDAFNITHSNDRDDYETIEKFTNFRAINCGDIKDGIIYRSASPFDNTYNRASYTDEVLEKYGVNIIINLNDNKEEISNTIKENYVSSYVKSMYEDGKIITLDMSTSYGNSDYKEKLAEGLRFIINNEGPYLIHCLEGKDRTGFVSFLLEALCNATYDELLCDYMLTYENYYDINNNNQQDKYNAIVDVMFGDFIDYINSLDGETLKQKAESYLLSANMTPEEICSLVDTLTK